MLPPKNGTANAASADVKTTTGAGAPAYVKYKVEGKVIDEILAVEKELQDTTAKIDAQMQALEEEDKANHLKFSEKIRELAAASVGKKGADVVPTFFDKDVKLMIIRDLTADEIKRRDEFLAKQAANDTKPAPFIAKEAAAAEAAAKTNGAATKAPEEAKAATA